MMAICMYSAAYLPGIGRPYFVKMMRKSVWEAAKMKGTLGMGTMSGLDMEVVIGGQEEIGGKWGS